MRRQSYFSVNAGTSPKMVDYGDKVLLMFFYGPYLPDVFIRNKGASLIDLVSHMWT